MSASERRRYSRLSLPMFYRPARLLAPRRAARDVSRGGIRAHTDDALVVGARLEIELFLPGRESLTVDVRVAWIRELPGGDARYEAGLEFLEMDAGQAARLDRCLARYEIT
ncbi:MAG: PilZ domain-containing protein [Acidobacteria bacterium]|nr:PilZ domain-containing protein [Acidobacteriota bacterium]